LGQWGNGAANIASRPVAKLLWANLLLLLLSLRIVQARGTVCREVVIDLCACRRHVSGEMKETRWLDRRGAPASHADGDVSARVHCKNYPYTYPRFPYCSVGPRFAGFVIPSTYARPTYTEPVPLKYDGNLATKYRWISHHHHHQTFLKWPKA